MKRNRSTPTLAFGLAALGLGLLGGTVWGSHVGGVTSPGDPRMAERLIVDVVRMEGHNTLIVQLEPAGSDKPLVVNQIQLVGPFGIDNLLTGLNEIDAVRLGANVACKDANILVGPDWNVLRALASASESPCSGAVLRGGPLGSEFVLQARGRLYLSFANTGRSFEYVQVGVLTHPGARLTMYGAAF